MFQRLAPGHHAAERRGGHRQRRARGAQGRPLPDQVRRPADQDLGVGRRDVAQRARRARSSTPTRSSPRSSTRRTAPGIKVAAHAHGDAGIRACIRAGVDCIEHGSLASDETIQLMVEHGTFLVPTSYLSEGLDVSRAAPELQAKAAEVFPKAPRDARQGDRGRREDRVRHRRARDPARRERQGALGDGRPRHDADAGAARGHAS